MRFPAKEDSWVRFPNLTLYGDYSVAVTCNTVNIESWVRIPLITLDIQRKAYTMKERHLSVNYLGAYLAGDKRHSDIIMKSLGITYRSVTPQTLGDCMWYWYCKNVPDNLPPFITDIKNPDPNYWLK